MAMSLKGSSMFIIAIIGIRLCIVMTTLTITFKVIMMLILTHNQILCLLFITSSKVITVLTIIIIIDRVSN